MQPRQDPGSPGGPQCVHRSSRPALRDRSIGGNVRMCRASGSQSGPAWGERFPVPVNPVKGASAREFWNREGPPKFKKGGPPIKICVQLSSPEPILFSPYARSVPETLVGPPRIQLSSRPSTDCTDLGDLGQSRCMPTTPRRRGGKHPETVRFNIISGRGTGYWKRQPASCPRVLPPCSIAVPAFCSQTPFRAFA